MEPGTVTGGGTMAHLAKLFDMARDRSSAGRRALADKVGDFYFAGHDLSKRERDLVVDILRQVIRDAEMDVRLGLAVHDEAPHDRSSPWQMTGSRSPSRSCCAATCFRMPI
jgi:hypothetical protein